MVKETQKLSKRKHYFIRNIIWEAPRHEIFNPVEQQRKIKIQNEYQNVLKDYIEKEYNRDHFLNEKQAHSKMKDIKNRALSRALGNIRELEMGLRK